MGEEETEKCEGRVPGRGGPGQGQSLVPAQLLVAADLEPGASVSSLLPPSLPVSVRIEGGDNCWDVVGIWPTGLPTLLSAPHPGSSCAALIPSTCS